MNQAKEYERQESFNLARELNPLSYPRHALNVAKFSYTYNPAMYSATRGQIRLPGFNKGGVDAVTGMMRLPSKIPYINKAPWFSKGGAWDRGAAILRGKIRGSGFGGILSSDKTWGGIPQKVGAAGFQQATRGGGFQMLFFQGYKGGTMDFPQTGPVDTTGKKLMHWGNRTKQYKDGILSRSPLARSTRWIGDRFSQVFRGKVGGAKVGRLSGIIPGVGKLAARSTMFAMKGFAVWNIASAAYGTAASILKPFGAAAVNAFENISTTYEDIGRPEMGGQLAMSYLEQGAATERQRALQAIAKAQINGRSALGRESEFIHR